MSALIVTRTDGDMSSTVDQPKLIRIAQVVAMTGMSRAWIYLKISDKPGNKYFDPNFPSPIRVSTNSIRWVELELIEWIRNRIKASR